MRDAYRKAMDEILLSNEADAKIRQELFCAQVLRQKKSAGKRSGKALLRAAVAVTAILLLAVTVYAAGTRIYMIVTRERDNHASVNFEESVQSKPEIPLIVEVPAGEEQEMTVYEAQYQFPRELSDSYVELGYWLPECIPEGYEQTFISDRAYDSQTILYGNAAGNEIRYEYAKPSGFGGVTMYGVISEETVVIGESEGVLFRKTYGSSLFWTREAEGLGFWLSADDPAVDLVEMAQSVAACEPFRSEQADANTAAALEQLGDYNPAWLPDGFEERDAAGIPIPEDGWYGYIRKFYTDYATNRELCLSYEPFVIPADVNESEPAAYFVQIQTSEERTDVVTEETLVNEMTAVICINPRTNAVHWLDEEQGLMFTVSSASVSVEELLHIAESVE